MSKYIVDIHGEIEGDYEIVGKYEEQEPATKNDSAHNLCDSCTNIRCEFQSGIVRTKCAFYMPPQHSSGLEKNSQKLEKRNTKNDLGVDYRSLEDIKKLVERKADALDGVMLDAGGVIIGLYFAIANDLPPVTPQELRWIPVSEKLPNTDDEVLCWYEYYHWSQEKVLPEYGLGRYLRETSAWFGEVSNGKDVRVLAWMPLPEPYKG